MTKGSDNAEADEVGRRWAPVVERHQWSDDSPSVMSSTSPLSPKHWAKRHEFCASDSMALMMSGSVAVRPMCRVGYS